MKNNLYKSLPIFIAFLCMGFGDVVGPLTSQLQTDFQLNDSLAALVAFMGFIMFGILSVPVGILQDRTSKKKILTIGLVAAFAGLLLPIIGKYSSFTLLLASLFLLGTGATILQVAGNPIMRDVSPDGKFSRNLSFGQFIKAIGSLSGALIPLAAVYFGKDWKIIFPIYSGVLFIAILYLWMVKIDEKKWGEGTASISSIFKLLTEHKFIRLMVLGIFLYVGAEVCMSSKLPNFLQNRLHFDIKVFGLWGTLFFFLALMTGRFMGSILLNWLSPIRFLQLTVITALAGIVLLYFSFTSLIAFSAIFIIGLGFANIFPLIFSITIDKMPERSNEISGLMVTAIIGGAIVPLVFGFVASHHSLMTAFAVPTVCIIYIAYLSVRFTK